MFMKLYVRYISDLLFYLINMYLSQTTCNTVVTFAQILPFIYDKTNDLFSLELLMAKQR